MVAIIDYGMGNVASVQKALNFLNIKSVITDKHEIIKDSLVILLPGVGSFAQGMINLKERGLEKILYDQVIVYKKPFLGICLGMHLLFEKGFEPYECEGLGWIKGEVRKFEHPDLNVPHMGWNDINVINSMYYKEITNNDFYFIHSYYVVPDNPDIIAATVDYGTTVTASIQKENIFATQFHPEKSQLSGLTVLKNFFDINA